MTGSGARQSMFQRVIARVIRPNRGTASKAMSSHAATRFQPSAGIVNPIRHVR